MTKSPLLAAVMSGVNPFYMKITILIIHLLGRHGSDSLCRVERKNKMAAT